MTQQEQMKKLAENGSFAKISYKEFPLMADPVAFVVYVALCSFANWTTGEDCFPSAQAIADRAQVTRNTVFKKLKVLERDGWIRRISRRSGGHQTSNLYEFPARVVESRVSLDGTMEKAEDGEVILRWSPERYSGSVPNGTQVVSEVIHEVDTSNKIQLTRDSYPETDDNNGEILEEEEPAYTNAGMEFAATVAKYKKYGVI